MFDPSSHPIIDVAADALATGKSGLVLSASGKARLDAALRARFHQPDLEDAVRALLWFAFFLEQGKESPRAAAAIVNLLKAAREPLLLHKIQLEDVVSHVDREERARRLLSSSSVPQRSRGKAEDSGAPVVRWWETMASSKKD